MNRSWWYVIALVLVLLVLVAASGRAEGIDPNVFDDHANALWSLSIKMAHVEGKLDSNDFWIKGVLIALLGKIVLDLYQGRAKKDG